MDYFKNKKILITGGTGSLGVEILKELIKHNPKVIRIFSRDESKQFELKESLREYNNIRYLLGDVREKERMAHAVKDIDIIFHVAALKHVEACEYNPFEALKTNIIGTANVIETAIDAGVKRVVFTSTDKATNPCNVMGVSKLFAERLITAGHYYAGTHNTIMCTVRLGNVIGSRGSFVPLLKKQIEQGGPVTLTDPNMTRFVMSLSDALGLLFESVKLSLGGEVFILKMPVVRIIDLIEVMIEECAPKNGLNPKKVEIKHIGVKPGEKLYEELITPEEVDRAIDLGKMFALEPQVKDFCSQEFSYKEAAKVAQTVYSSDQEKPMTKPQIKQILEKAGIL